MCLIDKVLTVTLVVGESSGLRMKQQECFILKCWLVATTLMVFDVQAFPIVLICNVIRHELILITRVVFQLDMWFSLLELLG